MILRPSGCDDHEPRDDLDKNSCIPLHHGPSRGSLSVAVPARTLLYRGRRAHRDRTFVQHEPGPLDIGESPPSQLSMGSCRLILLASECYSGCIRTFSTSLESGRPAMVGVVTETQKEVQDHRSRVVDCRLVRRVEIVLDLP